jgi:hypothetical protein
VTIPSLGRSLLAASLCLAPLGWAAAQDQRDELLRQKQQQQQQTPQHQEQRGQPHPQPGPPANPAPQVQHSAPGNGQQQHPALNHPPPPAPSFQRSAPPTGVTPTNAPPGSAPAQTETQRFRQPGATTGTAPAPGTGQQHPALNNPPPTTPSFQHSAPPIGVAPTSPPPGSAPAPTETQRFRQPGPTTGTAPAPATVQQQQQFQQRAGQRGGAPAAQAAPAPLQQQQQQTTRSNFQGGSRGGTAVFSERHAGAAPAQFRGGLFYGRDYRHFSPREVTLWHSGRWHHEFRDGRDGWWYDVDGIWYFYPEPIYPYPTFIPDVVYIPEEEYDPPVYVAAPPAQYDAPTNYYYFCPDSQTYYPYVTGCASPWQEVPAAPQQ